MNKIAFLIVLLTWCIHVSPSQAELDLEREVLIIPDTHNEKPYIWNVMRNPKEFELSLELGAKTGGTEIEIRFSLRPEAAKAGNAHVFATDEVLHTYRHIRPARVDEGAYAFPFDAPSGKYRFEIVFRTDKGWVNLRKDLKIRTDGKGAEMGGAQAGDEDYGVRLKLIPKKAYAEHVTTFLYEISYRGRPLERLEKMEGSDMQLATWDEDLKEFIYAVPRQNLGGPEVAVSVVFMRPGRHAVFAEFKHKGVVRKIETVVDVLTEPRERNFIDTLRPSD